MSAEIAILKSLQHPNVVSYYGHEEKDGQLRIYMEFVPKSLSQVITQRRNEKRPFTALEIKQIALGVAKGLDYLHTLARPIMHRDIKARAISIRATLLLTLFAFRARTYLLTPRQRVLLQ